MFGTTQAVFSLYYIFFLSTSSLSSSSSSSSIALSVACTLSSHSAFLFSLSAIIIVFLGRPHRHLVAVFFLCQYIPLVVVTTFYFCFQRIYASYKKNSKLVSTQLNNLLQFNTFRPCTLLESSQM